MARTNKGTASHITATSSWTALSSIALTTGNTLIVLIGQESGVSPSGITWNSVAMTSDLEDASTDLKLGVWRLSNVTGATGNIVVTWPSSITRKVLCAVEVDDGSLTIDKTAEAHDDDGGSQPASGSTATTTNATECLQGVVLMKQPTSEPLGTWAGDTTTDAQSVSTIGAPTFQITITEGYAYQTVQATRSASKTGTNQPQWIALIATYAIGPLLGPGGGVSDPLPLMEELPCRHRGEQLASTIWTCMALSPSRVNVAHCAACRQRDMPGLSHVTSCMHRGREIARVKCDSCQGNVMLKVFACDLHSACTLSRRLADKLIRPGDYMVCTGCPQATPAARWAFCEQRE